MTLNFGRRELSIWTGCSMGCPCPWYDRFYFTRYPGEVTFIEWEWALGPLSISWWRNP